MTKETKIVNKHKEDYDVYIGRGSIWGNPYRTGVDGTRNEVIDLYGVYLRECLDDGRISHEELLELEGKTLGCFCKPKKRCHGEEIIKAISEVRSGFQW